MSAAGRARKDLGGFTLIEMLVVLAITGLVSALAFPALDRALRRQAFEAAANAIDLGLREARADAIRTSQPTRFVLGADRRSIVRYGAPPIVIPRDMTLSLPTRGIGFYGDGTSTGGEIAIGGIGRGRRLSVDPGSGAVAAQQ
jgi:general secretion pathway protein H